jgi:hypothetical protein
MIRGDSTLPVESMVARCWGRRTQIREVTYQGLRNVVDAARSSGFKGRMTLASVVGADRSSLVISLLNTIKSGLQRNLMERELYLRASGLDYTIVRAPILTSAPAGQTNVRITLAVRKLTAGPKMSRGDLARVMILASEQAVESLESPSPASAFRAVTSFRHSRVDCTRRNGRPAAEAVARCERIFAKYQKYGIILARYSLAKTILASNEPFPWPLLPNFAPGSNGAKGSSDLRRCRRKLGPFKGGVRSRTARFLGFCN